MTKESRAKESRAIVEKLRDMTYKQMSEIVLGIAVEVKARNSIGVNLYIPSIRGAAATLMEISNGEKCNWTSESGPRERD